MPSSAPTTNSIDLPPLPHPLLLSAFWFGTAFLWLLLLTNFMPAHVQIFVGDTQKELYLGILVAIGSIMALVIPPWIGAHSDRSGKRLPYLKWGVGVNVVGLAVMAWAITQYGSAGLLGFALYVVGFLLVQLGNNCATAPYSALIPQLIPSAQRGKYSGVMAALQAAGNMSGALTGVALGQLGLTLTMPFVVISVVLITSAFMTMKSVADKLESHSRNSVCTKAECANSEQNKTKDSWTELFKYPAFKWVFITRMLFAAGQYSVQPFLQYYCIDILKQTDPITSSSFMFLSIIVSSIISATLGGPLSDRIGRKPVIYAAGTLMTIAAVLFLLAPSFTMALIVAFFFGLGFGAFSSVDWALGADAMPSSHHYARDMGIWHVAFVAPQLVSAPQGQLLSWGNAQAENFGYILVFGTAAALFALGVFLVQNIPETQPKTHAN